MVGKRGRTVRLLLRFKVVRMSCSNSARCQGLRKKDAHVQLFPFLAVLICTMGTLIVLLVVFVQQAKVHAASTAERQQAAAVQASHIEEEQRLEQETYEWRAEMLKTQQEDIARQLAGERLKLSHVEDHYRRIRDELEGLVKQAAEMEQTLAGGNPDSQTAQAELAQVYRSLEAARNQLEQVQAQAAAGPQSFALIPYEGPHSTHRRPIYIECLRDRVVLQPEGVTLVDRDFEGPLGPGNPLDAALRATREHLARTGGVERHGEPYPLIVVRSQGPRSYAAVRAAIETWDDEFGYELVNDDLALQFPAPDPVLKETMQAAVEEARRRQEILRAAQPTRFSEGSAVAGFQATSRHGGFQAVGGGEEEPGAEGEIGGAGAPGGKPGFYGAQGSPDDFEKVSDGPLSPGAQRAQAEASSSQRGGSKRGKGGFHGGDGAGTVDAAGGVAGGTQRFGSTMPSGASAGGVQTPFAASRGRNWGLKDATAGATAYTRPIQVQCFADKLVLVPERGAGQSPVTIPMAAATRSAIDPFMQAVWKRTDGWGLAGNHAYWKPVLKVEVGPNAEDRFTDFQQLMEGSGLVIERKAR